MGNEHGMQSEHDDAIDKVLAALRNAVPPEGMDARMVERLRQPSAATTEFRWRDLLAGSALAGAWWRGAISGGAAAMVAVGLALGVSDMAQRHIGSGQAALSHNVATHNASMPGMAAKSYTQRSQLMDSRGRPCASPALRPAPGPASNPTLLRAETRSEAETPSHPAPAFPLTAQERALARLARTANPQVLIALNSETEAKREADETARFTKFFAPPPALPSSDDHPASVSAASPGANPEADPPANAIPTPDASSNSDSSPAASPDADPVAIEKNRSTTKEEE
jgi:hypothetical protein